MPAPPLLNTLESGQADTTVITTGNSTGEACTAFSAITGSPTFSTAHAHSGSLAMRVDTTATYAETHVDWTGLGSFTTSVWFRTYLYATANPVGASMRILVARTSTPGNSAVCFIQTDGSLRSGNAAQTGIGTTTTAIALNQWIRIEWRVLSSTTAGECEIWLYNTPEAPIGSFDSTASATGAVLGANTDGIRYGAGTAAGPNSFVGWWDDVAVSTTGQVGPSVSTYAPQTPAEFPPRHFGPF